MQPSKRIIKKYPNSVEEVFIESAKATLYGHYPANKGRITVSDSALYLEFGRWSTQEVERVPHDEVLAFDIPSQTESGLASMKFEFKDRPDLFAILKFKRFEMGTVREDMARFVDAFDGWSKPQQSPERVAERAEASEREALENLLTWQPGEEITATARGGFRMRFDPAVMAGSGWSYDDRWDGVLRLGDDKIYISWRQNPDDFWYQAVMHKRELTSWKHFERDGHVGIELATDEFTVQTRLTRSHDSDPDAFIEFCRSIEDDDLLLDALFAYSAILDWEQRQAADNAEHKEAAAETVRIVRELHPSVFVTAAEQMARFGTEPWAEGFDDPAAIDTMIESVVKESGYLEARRSVRQE